MIKEPFSGEQKNVFWIADFLRRGDRLQIPDYCEEPLKKVKRTRPSHF